MRNIAIHFFFILSINLFSQDFNTANYSCLVHLSDITKQADKQFNLLSKAENVAEDVNFRLEFDNEKSAFYNDNHNEIDPMSLQMLKALTNMNGNIYTNLTDSSVFKEINANNELVNFLGNEILLLKDSIFNAWEITTETKTINGYKCYKANYSRTKKILGKEYTEKAIAWFCPEIPVSYGPAGFSGLPGLIFQLQANEYSFVLKNIVNTDSLKVKTPSRGKVMSLDEYLNTSAEKMQKILEMVDSFKD